MLVGKQMLLAVFIIAIAFGTEPEFQIRPVPFRPAANGAFMPCNILRLPHLLPVYLLPVDFLWGHPMVIPCGKKVRKFIRDARIAVRPAAFEAMNIKTIQITSTIPIHFALMGIRKYRRNSILGKITANARNSDIVIYWVLK